MGSVYRATAPDGRPVAAKRLLDEKHAARFEIEGRLLARLDHPRVVKVLGTVFDPSGRYLMMEWVDGEDLAHVLRREGTPGLTEDQVIKHTLEPTGNPSSSPRSVSITGVIGWCCANPWSHDGIVSTGTNALLA